MSIFRKKQEHTRTYTALLVTVGRDVFWTLDPWVQATRQGIKKVETHDPYGVDAKQAVKCLAGLRRGDRGHIEIRQVTASHIDTVLEREVEL